MTIILTWRDANNVATVLSEANGYKVLRPTMGLGVAPPQNTIEPYIAFDGAALMNRRRNTQSVILPILVRHATRAQTLIEALASMLNNGPGQLEYADGLNTRYLKNVIYDGGLSGNLSDAPNPLWRKIAVSLLALDPWWYGPGNSVTVTVTAVTAFDAVVGFDLFIPFDGGSTAGVAVVGDTDAYPVVTVTGPAATLTVGTGGLFWSIQDPLLAGDVLVVDHRPGSRGPVKNGGLVDWSLLSEASRLWTLPAGTDSVITGSTGTSGATSVVIAFEPRYLTP